MTSSPAPTTELRLETGKTAIETCEPKMAKLKPYLKDLIRKVFEGHEEFLGWTPD